MTQDVVILGGTRTAIGAFGGALAGIAPSALAAAVAKEAMLRSGVEPGQIGHTVFGHVINTEGRDMYLGRVAAVEAGIPPEAPSLTVNRLCGSGAEAVARIAQHIMLGDVEFGLAGGAESMSRAPHSTQTIRWGQKMGDMSMTDMMIAALSDPFGNGHMGITAENVADAHHISREVQDAFAVESQNRALRAIAEGRFTSQILPIEVKVKRDMVAFATDEHPKAGTTMESLGKLRPAFRKDGSVTAGNASGLNDGAAALVLASAEAAEKHGLKPWARLLGYSHAGVAPEVMGLGPIPAVSQLVARLGMSVSDFDVIESNEAFAAQACAVSNALGFDPAKVNPNGGAIALGHPLGATGAILTVKALYELERIGGRFGLVTMCIGGGQGIALAVERLS
jgi:acetyl-CoA C-acetyltransferase